jgi:hypothetical protein
MSIDFKTPGIRMGSPGSSIWSDAARFRSSALEGRGARKLGVSVPTKEKGESCDSPFGKGSLPREELATDWRIRGTSRGRRILTDHARLIGEVIVGARRGGDGNGINVVSVDAAGGVAGAW